jgi:hypothetical protein
MHFKLLSLYNAVFVRGVAQPSRALASGARDWRFEFPRPDR